MVRGIDATFPTAGIIIIINIMALYTTISNAAKTVEKDTLRDPEESRPPPAFDSSDVRASRARLLQTLDVFADEITRDPVDELDAPLNVDASLKRTRAPPVARCCCCLSWLFPKPAPPSPAEVELPEWRPRKPKYAKVATTPSAGRGFAIADDGSDSD